MEAPLKVRCKYCGYEWWTKSKMMYITCPRCHGKNRNPHYVKK